MDQQFLATLKIKMQKALSVISEDLATIRTGRASPALVENIIIPSYGGTQHLKIKEMATISTDGPRMIVIAPFDPSVIADIERGIGSASLGFTGSVDGNIIRINIQPLTAERRDEYVKLAHTKLEGGRVMIRQIRHEAMQEVKKKSDSREISEDDRKRLEKEVQTLTDEMITEIDVIREKKEAELSQI